MRFTYHISRFDFKPSQDVGEMMASSVDNTLHVQCLVLIGLVLHVWHLKIFFTAQF